jgi:ribosomal-protein-alanine N-acetyltransferase
MEIRKMTEADLPEVCAIENDTFSDPWREEDFRSSLKEPNNDYLIAEVDGKLAGYCGYWGIAGEGYIYNVGKEGIPEQKNRLYYAENTTE